MLAEIRQVRIEEKPGFSVVAAADAFVEPRQRAPGVADFRPRLLTGS